MINLLWENGWNVRALRVPGLVHAGTVALTLTYGALAVVLPRRAERTAPGPKPQRLATVPITVHGRTVAVEVRVAEHRVDGQRGHVRGVQEGGAFEADVDKRRLHARQDARHPALVDIADDAAMTGAFDVHFLQHTVLHHGDTRLLRRYVD